MYTYREITATGSQAEAKITFLENIKQFLIAESALKFELVEDDITASSTFTVESQALQIKVTKAKINLIGFDVRAISINSIIPVSGFTLSDQIGAISGGIITYMIKVLSCKNGNSGVITFAPGINTISAQANCFSDIAITNINDSIDRIAGDVSQYRLISNATNVSLSTGHKTVEDTTKLIYESDISINNSSDNYIAKSTDCVCLIGAKKNYSYKTDKGTFFCFKDNYAILM